MFITHLKVEHKYLFQALRKVEISEGYIKLLEDIYTEAAARIYIDKDVSQEININRGVRQGDPISPKIFTAVLEEGFKNTSLEGEMLTDLRFADDVALITSAVNDLEAQIYEVNSKSKDIGLKMHKGKTKYMANFNTDDSITVEDQEISRVNEYKYLGQTVKMTDNTKDEVSTRIKAGWSSFGRYRGILGDKNIPMALRRKVYDQCVLPTINYGAETWTTTKLIEQPKSNGETNATYLN